MNQYSDPPEGVEAVEVGAVGAIGTAGSVGTLRDVGTARAIETLGILSDVITEESSVWMCHLNQERGFVAHIFS